ncbi:MAG: hypothetical protein LAP21_16170 [Acidobacteriia bacterium]|nr:hypothetical protein [Terriglobia bacterium]
MNSKLLQAPGKLKAPHRERTNLPTRSIKNIWLGLAAILLLTAAGLAQNNNSALIVDNSSLFRPRGIIKAMVANPAAPGGVSWNWWVSDGASGFCRVIPDPVTGVPTRDLVNCDLPGVSEPSDYQAETFGVNGGTGYVFVAGIKCIERVEFMVDPANPAWTLIKPAVPGVPTSRVFIYNSAPAQGPTSIFTNGTSAVSNRNIESAKLGPDGKLYFIFQGSGDIWRVNNPLTPAMTPQGNTVERVGTSDNGNTLLSITWVGHDLWMAQAGFLNRLQNADLCYYTTNCAAQLEFGDLQIQEGMFSDQYNSKVANGRFLYWANGNRIVRYDTFSTYLMEVFAHQGTIPGQAVPASFTLIMGMNAIQPALPAFTPNPPVDAMRQLRAITDPRTGLPDNIPETSYCMDITLEAPVVGEAGNLPRTGRCYDLPTANLVSTDECQLLPPVGPGTPNPITAQTCIITSLIGTHQPIGSQQQVAARRAVLVASGVTHPRGLVFLNSNFWVSDEQLGFCRITINPADGSGSLTNCFTFIEPNGSSFVPGQPALDPKPNANGTLNVYVPDASGPGRGLVRLVFTPDATGGTVSQTGSLQAGPRTAYAAAMPNSVGPSNDGSVYVGYSDLATVNKIMNPLTSPASPIAVGQATGVGVLSMAFRGNDLILGELGPQANAGGQLIKGGQVTQLLSASPSLIKGNAVVITKAISRLASPLPGQLTPQVFINPGAIAIGPALDREKCLPPVGVVLSPRVGDPLVTPSIYLGSMGSNPIDSGLLQVPEVDRFGANCTTQIPWVEEASLDALHAINVQLGPVTALAFTDNGPTASMAIGDDPTTLPVDNNSLQKSGFHPPTTGGIGQGHVYIVP